MFKLFGFSVDAADSVVYLKDLIDTNDLDPLDLDPCKICLMLCKSWEVGLEATPSPRRPSTIWW